MKPHFYPPNRFNNKMFYYFCCEDCRSVSIHPVPSRDDMNQIYGVNDHSYLKSVPEGKKIEFNFNYPRYNHRKIQIDLFNDHIPHIKGKSIVDYATGSGAYLAFAKSKGFECIGIEYNREFAGILREKTGLDILPIEDFEKKYYSGKFDVIHFGHILEHLENPKELLDWAKNYSHDNTAVIIDGHLENNFCISWFVIKIISKLKGKKYNEYAPQHITFTNYRSQLAFFENSGLKTIKYKVLEQSFPLPETIKPFSFSRLSRYLLSKFSIFISSFNPWWGNLFHYIGKFHFDKDECKT